MSILNTYEQHKEAFDGYIEDRDAKAVTGMLSCILEMVGTDRATQGYVAQAMKNMAVSYRKWDDIEKSCRHAIHCVDEAIEEGRADYCIEFDHYLEQEPMVRCKQAEKILSFKMGSISRHPEAVKEALERIETVVDDVNRLLESKKR